MSKMYDKLPETLSIDATYKYLDLRISRICDVLRNLIPFVQFKKHE